MATPASDFDLALDGLEASVGATTVARGRRYAGAGRVLSLAWRADDRALTAKVVGSGRIYETTVFVALGRDGRSRYDRSVCSCPVGHRCKHAVAVAITAAQGGAQRARGVRSPAAGAAHGGTARRRAATRDAVGGAATGPALPEWERPLRALLDDGAAQRLGAPLAIAVEARRDGNGEPQLLARLKRPGARGGWITGNLYWDGLASWSFGADEYRSDHLEIAGELRAAYQVGSGDRSTSSYGYGPSRAKALDLTAFNSPQLWPLLERARDHGIPVLHGRPQLGEVEIVDGELCLDVRDGDGGIDARVVLRTDGAVDDAIPLAFLGAGGHGLACTAPEAADLEPDRWPLRLVRLARPAPPALRTMVLSGTRLRIPPDQAERFAHEIAPGLRRHAPVVSRDGSFVVPEVSPPRLELRAAHGDDHALELAWEWRYEIDGREHRAPLASTTDVYRDPLAEQAAIEATEVVDDDLRRWGLVDGRGRPDGGGPVALSGVDTAAAVTGLLPRLAGHEALELRQRGTAVDYRDVTDELRIGVSTRASGDDRDWFDLGVTISAEGQDVPFASVFAALADGASRVLLPDGAHFSLETPKLQALRTLIDEARELADAPAGAPLRISRFQTGLWEDLVALGVVTEQAESWQRQVDGLARLDALAEHGLPDGLDADLRAYQLDGFRWLAQLWELRLGGILADDMGLGKTLQTLALIAHAKERDPATGPFLVVAPTSVVAGWVTEAARFTPGLVVRALTDTLKKAAVTLDEALDGTDVLVTTYTLLRLDADEHCAVPWAGVILDEAQQVKNHQARTHGCVRRLDAPFKLAITGTPMENGLMELWSLFSIVAPGLFPSPKRFVEQYVRPIEKDHDAERLDRLRRRVRPLMLRRTKGLVAADLPPKQIQALPVVLHPRHRKLYDTHLQRERQRILGMLDDFDTNRFTILRAITLLRQMSLHPVLADPKHESVPSAKLTALVEQLEDVVRGGHRALVFSQFTGFLALVRERLAAEGIASSYLDGRTKQRAKVVARFKAEDDPVFLISLKAGGFGLNLTEADYCFLLDPWWNPAAEAQAIDRTHRIGQTRPVNVYRMIATGTIEEKVAALADRKAALFAGVMDDGDLFSGGVTADDIRGLLG